MKLGQCRLQFLAKAQTIDDCGRRIRISVCSPSLHYKTSKPQIQQQGAQGELRGTFHCGACYALPATRPERELSSWSLSLWSAERSVSNLRHLAWRHWRGEACRRLFWKAVDFFFSLHGSSKSGPKSSRECVYMG